MRIPISDYAPARGCGCPSVCIPRRLRLDNLAKHVDKRGLEPYARYTLLQKWSTP